MNVRFYVDPETEAPHIYKHGIDEEEVIDVLSNSGEDRPVREGSRVVICAENHCSLIKDACVRKERDETE